jgi:hypothetical protein
MMNTHAEWLWDAALSTLRPSCLIDRFLDWIEDVSAAMLPVQVNGLAVREVPTPGAPCVERRRAGASPAASQARAQ